VYNDIELLVKENVPKISKNYDELNTVLSDYRDVYQRNLPLLTTQKTKGGLEFALPNEALLQKAFQNADNLKQLQLTLQNTPQAESLLMRGTVDWLRTKGAVNKDGLVDPKQIRSILDKNQNIVNALPANVRAKVQDEVALADAYVARLGELDQRMVTAKNAELDTLLSKAARTDADPRQTLTKALTDPAMMRTLVNGMGKDPEMLAALRRSVWDVATEGAQSGGALKGFLDTNQKSLKVLYGDTQHLKDLNTLADLQRRVNAFADVTGQIPLFESIDQNLKRVMGFGVQFMTTTAREAMVGRISPETGALALLLRMTASAENQLYQRIFTKALEDPAFAQAITHVGTPAQGAKAAAQLEGIGANMSQIFNEPLKTAAPGIAQRIIRQELPQEQLQGRQAEIGDMKSLADVSRETSAKQMLKAFPPAPVTRGYDFNPRVSTTPPAGTGGMGQVQLMYPSMFPNDPISGLLQQRQAMVQGGQQPVPGQ
jgi:hypothetical protein